MEDISGLRIVQVSTVEGLRDFAGVLAGNWEPPDMEILRFYEATGAESLAEGSGQRFFVGYWAGLAVTVCELVLGPGRRAGLYGVATRQEYRRRGFGAAALGCAMKAAAGAGVREILVQCQRQQLGFYERLGFQALVSQPGLEEGEICLCCWLPELLNP